MLDERSILKRIIESLARYKAPTRGMGSPLWGVVANLAGLGSTRACELCSALGVDPHQYVLDPAWPDPAHQTIAEVCEECCAIISDPERGCGCKGLPD